MREPMLPDGRPFLFGEARHTLDVPLGLPGDEPVTSEIRLWLYIAKGLAFLLLGAFLLVNASYGAWELLGLLGG